MEESNAFAHPDGPVGPVSAYLCLAVCGLAGFLVIRPRLRVEGDPAATLANLVEHAWLAHLGIAFELLVVIAQAAAAVGFYALFRRDRPVAAYGVATFGVANAISILGSVALLVVGIRCRVRSRTALARWRGRPRSGSCSPARMRSGPTGAVFFGLWLIPMGWFAISTLRMPRALGWVLVVGGLGYVLSALLAAATPALPPAAIDLLTVPATVGELWMVGYLLIVGIRPAIDAPTPTRGIAAPVTA